MKEKLAKLIDVKSITTFGLIGTLCVLAIRQNVAIPSEALVAVVTAVVTDFFTRKEG